MTLVLEGMPSAGGPRSRRWRFFCCSSVLFCVLVISDSG